jgi:hypothetical protein
MEATQMKRVLGLTVVLALCLAGAALACDGVKGAKAASAGACMKGAKVSAASAGSCPMHATAAAKSGDACCAKGAKGAKGAKAMRGASACCSNMDAAACARMQHTSFTVAGLKDQASAEKVRTALAGMSAVKMVQCDTQNGTAVVCWKGAKDMEAVASKLTDAGYAATVLKADAGCPSSPSCPQPCKKGDKAGKTS